MKTVLYIVGGYLVLVGAAQLYSNSVASSPTADQIASFPSFNSQWLDLLGGAALIYFAPRIAAAV